MNRYFYNHPFNCDEWDKPSIIRFFIQKGGEFLDKKGRTMGAPLFQLYRDFQSIVWPDYEHDEWSDLCLKNILGETFTCILGPGDSGKTNGIARYALTDYFCFPEETLFLVSSTNLRSLNLRVFGEIKMLFNQARANWPGCPGNMLDSMHGIFTDKIEDTGEARDIRKGVIGIPVEDSNGQWIGLSNWIGTKQKRRRVFADEAQLYRNGAFLTTFANLNKGDFKGVLIGNPIADAPVLDKASAPVAGWESLGEITKTTTWRNQMGGVTVQLYGPDSPAIRHPGKHTYLINQTKIDWIEKTYRRDSFEWFNQALGVRTGKALDMRIIPRDLAVQFGAQDEVVWGVKSRTKVYAIDASYGGDRCPGGHIEFGEDINGKLVISCTRPTIIPIKLYPSGVPESERVLPEDQITLFVMQDCESKGIPARNVFYDSTGRGSLGTSFARIWSNDVNPVEFGGVPSNRPVCDDMWIMDEKTHERRLKRADEHYFNKVTELCFSIRFVIEGRQMRNLPTEVLDELCLRIWWMRPGNKRQAEPKTGTPNQPGMKERIGFSPDLADWLAIAVEGARRLGFISARLEPVDAAREDIHWKRDLQRRAAQIKRSYTLTTASDPIYA